MVAVGPSPCSARLVRWTRRMADALNAPWIALSVDTGVPLSPEQQQRLDANLELARRLGAEAVSYTHLGFLLPVRQAAGLRQP